MKDFKYEIVKHITTLSENSGYEKQINIIRYEDGDPVVDIRKWDTRANRMLRGVTLNQKELEIFKGVLSEISLTDTSDD